MEKNKSISTSENRALYKEKENDVVSLNYFTSHSETIYFVWNGFIIISLSRTQLLFNLLSQIFSDFLIRYKPVICSSQLNSILHINSSKRSFRCKKKELFTILFSIKELNKGTNYVVFYLQR